ncbi:hypothetical protein LJB42_003227 [Komagataella kurtzmanii]|nr:hypothetical protein LJB42_003227 [Komagataella kurtzmanii]
MSAYKTDIEKADAGSSDKNSTYQVKTEDFQVDESVAEVSKGKFAWYENFTLMMKAETRGVEIVPEEEKTRTSLWEAASMWFSANLVIGTFALGAISQTVFALDFWSSVLCIIFFNMLGVFPVAFFSVFGVKFGLRQMILTRFLSGDLAMRLFAAINCICCVGWGAVNIMAAAQLLHIVNNKTLPPWAACLIFVVLTILVTFFGYDVIHTYEKWSWIPNMFVFIVIIARMSISGNFTFGTMAGGPTVAGNVLSFGGAIFGYASGWATFAADYTVYMRTDTPPLKIFAWVYFGLFTPLCFTMMLGTACATGIFSDESWATLYDDNGVGGLVYAVLVENSLHGFGQFCCVLLALSTVANNIPNMYSIGLSAQAVTSKARRVPRIVWTLCGNSVTLAISIPAYYHFENFMSNFMNIIGYNLAIYDTVCLSEHFIWKRGFSSKYDVMLEQWHDKTAAPPGYAGLIGFGCGAAGVVLGMNQVWYSGAIGTLIGDFGGDVGFELAAGFSFLGFNTARYFELKYCGR